MTLKYGNKSVPLVQLSLTERIKMAALSRKMVSLSDWTSTVREITGFMGQ